ncbi:hypothetical protein [Pollutimonas thiosulfatoxidans]|uniref:Uncharacterized protein n=1 Tax=Pollutimonas thiosulfatoxidans TaxID=2028345 RepID=A0A410GBD2_9BURK|nr:hypothetical protein [Pollutimonas thiosulfatoxidans]QAA93597.1 hypothetical protein CKA81_06925 [Pollutimonas thiosulfatoxidans]
MPLLIALDEYESALRTVSIHAQIGLEAGPHEAQAALRMIFATCEKAAGTVEDVLSHPDAAAQVCAIDTSSLGT